MGKPILIAFAGNYDSTKEIAQYIAGIITRMGGIVEVKGVEEIRNLAKYDAVIIGSAARMDKLLGKTLRFARRHADELRQKITAYFVTCITMKNNTPENREKATGFLQPLCRIKEPVGLGLFGGKLEYSKIGFLWKAIARQDKTGYMVEGDFRDWSQIKAWAMDIGPRLLDPNFADDTITNRNELIFK
ncbi:MAG: flavodoxin/nitric oxide synthase [Bacteroidetes bacterium]|nr:flavodoxin/nitric oxide synthase [Bacteroidota bacterium]